MSTGGRGDSICSTAGHRGGLRQMQWPLKNRKSLESKSAVSELPNELNAVVFLEKKPKQNHTSLFL